MLFEILASAVAASAVAAWTSFPEWHPQLVHEWRLKSTLCGGTQMHSTQVGFRGLCACVWGTHVFATQKVA